MDTWMNVAIVVGGVIIVVLCCLALKGNENLKPDVVPLVVQICEIVEVIIIACIIGNVVGKFAPRDEKVTDPLPVMTNGYLRVSGTLTFHVMEVEKHEPQK